MNIYLKIVTSVIFCSTISILDVFNQAKALVPTDPSLPSPPVFNNPDDEIPSTPIPPLPPQSFPNQNFLINIGTNFTGTSFSQSGFFPPDTMGAVGINHIVELINGQYAIYDKMGGLISRTSLNQFWVNAGVTRAGAFAFDPRIVYDLFTNRWFASSVDNAGGANNFLVAVSNSSDPTTGWTGFAIDSDLDNSHWADFDTLGFNQESLTISANMFSLIGGSTTTTILTIDKAELISSTTGGIFNSSDYTLFENINPNNTGFTVQPVIDMDNRNNPHALLSAYNTPSGSFKRSNIVGNQPVTILNTTGGLINVNAYNSPPLARQQGGPNNVNTTDNRFSSNIIQQLDSTGQDSFWGVQSVRIPAAQNTAMLNIAGLRWFEIDATSNVVLQEGLIYDPTGQQDYYFPSIAVNDSREVVIGFSCSGSSLFISSCAVVGGEQSGVITFGDPFVLQTGMASYQRLDGNGRNRWGDYSVTLIDPFDVTGRTFWTFQEFASSPNQWSTQITEIIIEPIPPEPELSEPNIFLGLLIVSGLGLSLKLNKQ